MPLRSWLTLLASLLLLGLASCQRETTPPLIQVTQLSPREIEAGDRVVIEGIGFPEGKTAHVAFRGDLHRPGVEPVRGVEIDVDAVVGSGTEIEIPVTEGLLRLFAGAGDHAAHTTFSGELSVAFAARSPAAPPVEGILGDAWLDVRPPTPHRAVAEAEAAEGARTLAFLGIVVDPTPLRSGGLLIQSIAPGLPADAARLLAGDVLTELDGVRVLSTRDLVAVPGERIATLKIRRDGSAREAIADVSLAGLAPPTAASLLGPVLILGLATVLLLLFYGPTPMCVTWIERRLAERLRDGFRVRARAILGFDRPGTLASSLLMLGAASVTLALLPLARPFGGAEIDVGLLFVATETGLATMALLGGGARAGRPYSLALALRAVGRVVSLAIVPAAGIVAVVMMNGSLRLEELVGAQGGAPWRWTAFASPHAAGLACLWFVAEWVHTEEEDGALPDADPCAVARPVSQGSRLYALARSVSRFVMCGLAAAIFLGGWQLPGLAPEHLEAHLAWTLLGAALFVVKAWLLVAAVLVARWALPLVPTSRIASLCWRWLVPVSLLLVGVAALWTTGAPGPSAQTLIGAVMVGVACAAAAHVVLAVRYFQGEGAAKPGLDPFL